ncbi:MAG: hypothetical protein ACREK6_13325 [Candidatus Rokuibacteriota bacterium]
MTRVLLHVPSFRRQVVVCVFCGHIVLDVRRWLAEGCPKAGSPAGLGAR